jgi:hypothetical protein
MSKIILGILSTIGLTTPVAFPQTLEGPLTRAVKEATVLDESVREQMKRTPVAAAAVVAPALQPVMLAVPVESQQKELAKERTRLRKLCGITSASFYAFDALPAAGSAAAAALAREHLKTPDGGPIEFTQREVMDGCQAFLVVQKQLDELTRGDEYAYIKYHERMRKLGVVLPPDVTPPAPGETRMWPRDTTPTMGQGALPPQVLDCRPRQESFRQWVKVPVKAGFDERSGEAIHNWSWEPVTRVRMVKPYGC